MLQKTVLGPNDPRAIRQPIEIIRSIAMRKRAMIQRKETRQKILAEIVSHIERQIG
jgi:hypothetical protein